MTKAYYTPTISAMILSPNAMAKEKGCSGYTMVCMFDAECTLRLHHCRLNKRDIMYILKKLGGLLFTDALILPANEAQKHGPYRPYVVCSCQIGCPCD
jgi:hypothetical protein